MTEAKRWMWITYCVDLLSLEKEREKLDGWMLELFLKDDMT